MNDALRQLPSVDEVALRLNGRTDGIPRRLLINEIRWSIERSRQAILKGRQPLDIDRDVMRALRRMREPSLRHVINATGVVLHTNLGRAPLVNFVTLTGYSNLEYDLETGKRGKRDTHLGGLLEALTGRPGIAVNNNAAAVYLVLHELAAGGEVIVSRGQLIEIGDGFRIPDIMTRAGVTLREVGTTNRTNIDDYRNAINERTRLLLIVHPSNFRISGFTGQPSRLELVELGREKGIPVYEDLGSGCVVDLSPYGIHEPLAQECIHDGVGIVSFSGDKLLGGPQAGLIAGDTELVQRVRRNPMFRAFRLDKLILQVLETTLRHLVLENYDALPALRMIRESAERVGERSEALLRQVPDLQAHVEPATSVIGGGSTPEQTLPTFHIVIDLPDAVAWERALRLGDPPVIAMIENNKVRLDLRTVSPVEEPLLLDRLRSVLQSEIRP